MNAALFAKVTDPSYELQGILVKVMEVIYKTERLRVE